MASKAFDTKAFLKSLAVLAVPVALQNLLTTTGSMIDTMMIAPLGENTVGAVGLCAQFSSLMFSCYWGFVGGGMLFFAQYWGAKDDDGIDRAYGTTLSFMLVVALIFSGLALLAPTQVMRLYTDKIAIQTIGISYLKVIGFAYIFNILATIMSALLRSTEQVRIPLYAAIASVCSNIFLNWVLIYGHLGLPAMGVQGAALATTLAGFINCSCLLAFAVKIKYPYLFHFNKYFRWSVDWMKEYLIKCFPIICNELLIGIGNMVINIVLGRQSEPAIAAVAVFRVMEGLVIGFFAGFSNAASILVGKSVGAGELEDAYQRAKRLVFACGTCILVVVLTVFALHKPILTAMSLHGESYYYGTGLLLIYCIIAVIRMCNWVQNDTYRSAGDAAYGTILEISFMYLLLLPCVLLAGLYFKAPFFVVFAFCYIDEPIRFFLMQRHMYSGKWIKPVTPQGKAALEEFFRSHNKNKA